MKMNATHNKLKDIYKIGTICLPLYFYTIFVVWLWVLMYPFPVLLLFKITYPQKWLKIKSEKHCLFLVEILVCIKYLFVYYLLLLYSLYFIFNQNYKRETKYRNLVFSVLNIFAVFFFLQIIYFLFCEISKPEKMAIFQCIFYLLNGKSF